MNEVWIALAVIFVVCQIAHLVLAIVKDRRRSMSDLLNEGWLRESFKKAERVNAIDSAVPLVDQKEAYQKAVMAQITGLPFASRVEADLEKLIARVSKLDGGSGMYEEYSQRLRDLGIAGDAHKKAMEEMEKAARAAGVEWVVPEED